MKYKLPLITVLLIFVLNNYAKAQSPPLLIAYQKGNKWGFSDTAGKLVIPAVYDYAYNFSGYDRVPPERQLAIVEQGNKRYCINPFGQRITPPNCYTRQQDTFRNRIYETVEGPGGLQGVYENGKMCIPVQYQYLSYADITPGAFVAVKNNLKGVITVDGKIIVPFKFQDLGLKERKSSETTVVWEAFYSVEKGKQKGNVKEFVQVLPRGVTRYHSSEPEIIKDADEEDRQQGESLEKKWQAEKITILSTGRMAIIEKDGRQGFLLNDSLLHFFKNRYNIKGYTSAWYGSNAACSDKKQHLFFIIEQDGKKGLIDEQENLLLAPEYNYIGTVYEYGVKRNALTLNQGNKYGAYILGPRNVLIPLKYNELEFRVALHYGGGCRFLVFSAKGENGRVNVGENGREYFTE